MTSNNSLYFLGAAVVGIVSAAGIFIAEHFRQERRRHAMAQDLARLDQQLSGMRKELEQLRQLQKENFYSQPTKVSTYSAYLPDHKVGSELQPHLTYRAFIRSVQRLKKTKRQATRTASSLSSASDEYNSAVDIDSSDLEFYDLSDDEDVPVASLDQIFGELDNKLNSGNISLIEKALDRLMELSRREPDNPDLLWRIAKAHHKIFSAATDKAVKQENLNKGLAVCEQAVKLNPNIAESHKWLAILIGARCETQPVKEKINGGFLFKQHLDAAVTLNPTDPSLHHLLGRFAYETASLKWYERKVAETFFADPPTATYEEALQYTLEAERSAQKDWKENKLLMAKCQIALGNYEDAVSSLQKAEAMQDEDCLSNMVESEIKTLLQKYNSYR